MTPLLVALGAAVGAPLRYWLASWLDSGQVPVGTLVVNVTGSCLLGGLVGAGADGGWLALAGTGFCGGFTTYSAFAIQAHRLGPAGGTAYAVTTVAAALAACWLGFTVSQWGL